VLRLDFIQEFVGLKALDSWQLNGIAGVAFRSARRYKLSRETGVEPDTIPDSRFRNQVEVDRPTSTFELNQPDAIIILAVRLDDPAH
jgi:hypothetical protein